MSGTPSFTYYEACVGAWRGVFTLTVTDRAALAAAPLSALDRLRFAGMRAGLRVFGGAVPFATTVTFASPSEVVHTTRIGGFGPPWFVSREVITLGADGRSGSIRIRQRLPPFYLPARDDGPFPVEIDEAARLASYALVFLGCPMKQIGERVSDDVVVLTQETAFSKSTQRLKRVR